MTGRVVAFPQQENPERDKRGRVILKRGQRWVEKKLPHQPWFISFVEEGEVIDNEKKIYVHLMDVKGIPVESCFTEETFRRRYRFSGDAHLESNQKAAQSKKVNNMKHWIEGPLIPSKKD